MPQWYGGFFVIGLVAIAGGLLGCMVSPSASVVAIGGGVAIAVLILILPPVVAYQRHHPYAGLVLLGTLLLGGTGIGWLAMLIWACVHKATFPREAIGTDSDTEAFRQWRAQQR